MLFDRGTSEAVHVPYGTPPQSHTHFMGVPTRLAPANGARHRLRIADSGWILATDACSTYWLRVLVRVAGKGAALPR